MRRELVARESNTRGHKTMAMRFVPSAEESAKAAEAAQSARPWSRFSPVGAPPGGGVNQCDVVPSTRVSGGAFS